MNLKKNLDTQNTFEDETPLLSNSSSLTRARRLIEEVGNAATRLDASFESRRATIRNLAVLRSIEDQAREVSASLENK